MNNLNFLIPNKYIQKYNDTIIKLDDGRLEEDDLGAYFPFEHLVLVKDINDKHTIIHEIGHIIDIQINEENSSIKYTLSATNEFMNIYFEELHYMFLNYVEPEDYFAECYAIYCDEKERDRLIENAPKTYGYISKIMSDIKRR